MSHSLPLVLLIWSILAIHLCYAQTQQSASFFYHPPAEGITVNLGARVIVNWTTNWAGSGGGSPWVSLAVYQDNGAGRWVSETLLGKYHTRQMKRPYSS